VHGEYGLLRGGKTAVIEMASASGLPLVPPEERNPLVTTTRGTGELIRAAFDKGAQHLIVAIGGSATVDGGAGMAQALGAELLDANGREIGPGGGCLAELRSISLRKLDQRLKRSTIEVACDVDSPLTGPQGAARVYGPQKGATPEMLERLDAGLAHLAEVIQRDIGIDVLGLPGGGAAGGLGAGLVAFLGAKLRPGVEIVMDAVGFAEKLLGAALVITGEGKIDAQTARGKVVAGVARAAKAAGVPAVALVGAIGEGAEAVLKLGLTEYRCIADRSMSRDEAFSCCPELLARATAQVVTDLQKGRFRRR
jgi:glycerate kinase